MREKDPDRKDFSWVVTDYFTRDKWERASAAIGMILSSYDQDDIWSVVQRVLFEAGKLADESKLISELVHQLELLYYGNGDLPVLSSRPIPLYFLKADREISMDEVRIRGIMTNGAILETLPWDVWQKLRLETTREALSIIRRIIDSIEELVNFSPILREQLGELRTKAEYLLDAWNRVDPAGFIKAMYVSDDTELSFDREADHMTFRIESPNKDNAKFKLLSKDFFYNVQVLASQIFNSNDFTESMFHAQRVSGFLINGVVTRHQGSLLVLRPQDPSLLKEFILLVDSSKLLSDLASWHQYLTSDERLMISETANFIRGVLQFVSSKLLSICNYIIARNPVKKSANWALGEF